LIKDYSVYNYKPKEYICNVVMGSLIGVIIGYVFYSNILAIFISLFYGFLYAKERKKTLIEQRRWQLNQEFGDGLDSLSASLSAGYAVDNAFSEALKSLKLIYNEEAYIIIEFKMIVDKLNKNIRIDDILKDFAQRSRVYDIYNFTEVFITANKTGGDLIKIIRNTSKTISDKVEVKREIQTLISAKKMEANIMNVIPIVIILYLRIFSPEFLSPLYHNMFGILFMTLILFTYYITYRVSNKIMDIEV